MAVIMRNPRIFAILFVISVVFNLFLIGLVAGLYLQPHSQGDRTISSAWFFHPPIILKALPETQERLDPILHHHAPIVHVKVKELRQARRMVQQQIGQDELDKNALIAAFEQLRQAELKKSIVIHNVFIEAIGQLTKEERQRLNELLSNITRHQLPKYLHSTAKCRGEH